MSMAPVYRLYVDEHGTDTTKNLDHPQNRYLSLTGVAMTIEHARDFLTKEMNRIKAEILADDPDAPTIFHLSDIRQRKGPFKILNDPAIHAAWCKQLTRLMRDTQCVVITAILDKKWLVAQHHWSRQHPYHFLAEILFEKYVQFLERKNTFGDIMPEARNKSSNQALQMEFDRFRNQGTRYASALQICHRLPVSKLKFMEKHLNIAGLQLCDHFTYSSHYVARSYMDGSSMTNSLHMAIRQILEGAKYDRSGRGEIIGYGIKHIP